VEMKYTAKIKSNILKIFKLNKEIEYKVIV
jgi:hypothetical protein